MPETAVQISPPLKLCGVCVSRVHISDNLPFQSVRALSRILTIQLSLITIPPLSNGIASHGETQFQPDAAGTDGAELAEGGGVSKAVLLIPLAALLGAAGFGGWKLTKYYKNKKRGYV